MSQPDALRETLLKRADARAKRLRTLAGDPYADGTERADADLIEALRVEVATLRAERDMWKEAYTGTDHAALYEEWQHEREHTAASLAAQAEAMETLEQEMRACADADGDNYPTHARFIYGWADRIAAMRTTAEK